MSEPRYREWILDTIDSLRSRKARPDLERICRMVRRRHGSEPDRTCLELEKLIQEHAVLKVNYKGSVSYRNAAKVQRGSRRRNEQTPAKKPSSSSSSSLPGNNKRDELSTTAGMDSSMDEEEVSLDAPCTQLASAVDSGVSLSPIITDPETEVTRASPTPSRSVSSYHSTPEKDRDATQDSAKLAQSAAPQDTAAALQLAAICPAVQRSALMREEEPRAGESALTPDQLLSKRSSSPDEAVGSDHTEEQKCSNADEVIHTEESETVKNSGMKKGG
ncbi:Atherin [Bagarius yarrelli]|uniref:Atherin n=1 Tax=Bagarius yarrelli TaxID=175774 RepID=A0A556V8X1_BAGYA|nr:Atherin [Bagarius yarrelli]